MRILKIGSLRKQLPEGNKINWTIPVALLSMLVAADVNAFEFDTGNPEVKARWDNTVKYSAAWRLKDPSAKLTADPNMDDGDRNFGKGLISSRVDLLSEFDMSYQNVGARISAAAWYDAIYNRSNDNTSPMSANAFSVPYNKFTEATRTLHGRRGELLDAFVFGKTTLGSMPTDIRFGKHTLLYGESLFFGDNGIANGQAPLDIVKASSVPGSQFKEIMRPVEQISGQLQVSSNVSVGAYYQLRWKKSMIPAVGSYMSDVDFVGDGCERYIAGAPGGPFLAPPAFYCNQIINAKNSGQGGIQLRFRPGGGDVDYGLYAIRYHEKTPQLYLRPQAGPPNFATGQVGQFVQVYHEGVRAFGASFSTSAGPVNVGGEVSVRRNTSLTSDPQVDPFGTADNDVNPLYAVGNSAHAQVSAIYLFSPSALWDGGTFLGEIAMNRRTSITKNASALDANTTRDAWGLRFIFEPAYFQVLPGLDITVPIGVGYNPSGRSSTMLKFNRATIEQGGDFSIGVTGKYQNEWKLALNYTKYFGSEDAFLKPNSGPGAVLAYKQSLKDRDFISFSIQNTF